jgi:hypothetical protein
MNNLEKYAAKRVLIEKLSSLGVVLRGASMLNTARRVGSVARRGLSHGIRSAKQADKAGKVVANKATVRASASAANMGGNFRRAHSAGKAIQNTRKSPFGNALAGAAVAEGGRRGWNAIGGGSGAKNRLKNAWQGLKTPTPLGR